MTAIGIDGVDDGRSGSLGYVVAACCVAALGGLLFGYDTAVISGAIGFLKDHFYLTPAAKGWAASSALVGCIIGVAIAGVLSDWLGRKKVLILSGLLFLISAIGTAVPELFAGLSHVHDTERILDAFITLRIVGGVGVGVASMTSPMYIAEISPARIRGRLVSINQFAIVFGMLVVYFVNYYIEGQGSLMWNLEYGWRYMFGSEAIPALFLLVAAMFVPESPRWLTKQGRADEALSILTHANGAEKAGSELQRIKTAIARESGSIVQLFKPGVRVVLIMGVALAILQQVTGINVILYYGPEIFKKTGIETNVALLWQALVGGVNLLFTVVAIWTVDKLGRKPLMTFGAAGMGIALFALGFAFFFQSAGAWALVFVVGFIACFAMSVGPVTWVILSEVFPNRIRGRAMSIATVCLWSANFLVSQTFPMMNENEWLTAQYHNGFPFWVYGVFCVVLVVVMLTIVPETKGKSLEEIEVMLGFESEASE